MGTEVFEAPPPMPPRPWGVLKDCLKADFDVSRLKAGRLMGQRPEWGETLSQARIRYAKRFLDHLRRARHTKKSCLLVTHGHMVQAASKKSLKTPLRQVCATVLPATLHLKVVSVDYASCVLATCHHSGGRHAKQDVGR